MLRDTGDKLWAMFSSLNVTEGDLQTTLKSAGLSEDDLEAFLKVFGLSGDKAESFISQALSLLNTLGSSSSLEQKLKEVLSTLGVSDVAVQAAILEKVQEVLHQVNVSSPDVLADLQEFEAFLSELGVLNSAVLDQARELLKLANISAADVLAVVQHVQGFVSGLNVFAEAVKDLLGLTDINAGAMGVFDELDGFLSALGVSQADVKLVVEETLGFFKTLRLSDVPALFADLHGLMVVAGVPEGSLQDGVSSFLNEVKGLKSLIQSCSAEDCF